jgi:hypothetical protein
MTKPEPNNNKIKPRDIHNNKIQYHTKILIQD